MSHRDVSLQPNSVAINEKPNLNFEYQNVPLRRAKKEQRYLGRKIVSGKLDLKLPKNEISTSKYNVITFIPRNLMEQFSKPANVYFLIIGIMQTIDAITVTNGTPDTFAPLFIIVLITAIKDLYEDIKRHRSDREENRKTTLTLDPGTLKFEKKYWFQLRVGHIIKIHKDEYVPADILLLLSSDPKGQGFIETKNLDGETNLKHKLVPKGLTKRYKGETQGGDYEFNVQTQVIFEFEAPNPYLYTFNGSITATDGERMPLDANNFLLRGCSLRNTDWIYGLVTYTGPESKIMLNSVKPRTKRSRVENFMNKQILLIFFFQIVICVFAALFYSIWFEGRETELNYLLIPSDTSETRLSYNFGTRFGSWMLIFSNLVPISLLVTLEMVKFIQGTIISKDKYMFHEETKTGTVVQSSNLNEELGQIEYIFSDKTGTLTQNYMEFKKLIAKGAPYGMISDMKDISHLPELTNVNFRDSTFFNAIKNGDKGVEDYLISLAACHTIITEVKDGKILYNAASPDELALVNFAKFVGCEYTGIDDDGNMTIQFKGKTIKFKLLQVLEFTSKRKRMSVILQNEKGEIIIYTKGADSILLERMRKERNPEIDPTMKHLGNFADEGLRTLLIAYKMIPKNEYDQWAKQYLDAATASERREEKMEDLQALIEQDLLLIGATAIEDKLQDDVGGTIAFLKAAGIKVWVLTGDKIETAINIGFSCNLLTKELKLLIVDGKKKEEVEESMEKARKRIEKRRSKQPNATNLKLALIVSGDALIEAMQEPMSVKLMEIADLCEAVICCRVAPKQKADVVTLVRKTKPKVSTLAIGDGANDVNMITAAQVGVGIRGVEGQQAARASDYAFGEFKFLKRLLVFYGRESYRRNSTLILYNFYKNVLLVLPVFWIGFDMAFSGQRVYESWLYSLFNVFYASLPIVIYAFTDRQFANKNHDLMVYPFLYEPGLKSRHFNGKRFWLWFFNAICQSVILGIFSIYILESNFLSNGGDVGDMWMTGAMILAICVAIVNFKILTFSHTHTPVTLFVVFGSIALYIVSFLIVNFITGNEFEEMFTQLYSIANFWFGSVVIVVATTFFDLGNERYYYLAENKRLKIQKREFDKKQLEADAKKKEELMLQDTEQEPLVHGSKPEKLKPTPVPSRPQQLSPPLDNKVPLRKPSKGYGHTGYAFSQEEGNHFFRGSRKGLDHPQN